MGDGDKRDKRKIILRGDGSTEINFDFDQWRGREGKGDRGSRGRAGGGSFLPLLPISNFIYEMVEMLGKNRMDAILGSPGQDVRGSRPGRFRDLAPFH